MNITKPTKIEQGISVYEASNWPIIGDLFNSGLINLGNFMWGLFTLYPVTEPNLVYGYAKIFVSSTQPNDNQDEQALVSINNINPAYVSSETLSFLGSRVTISISSNPNTLKYNIDITSSLIKNNKQDHILTHRIETNVSIEPIYRMQPDVVYPNMNDMLKDATYLKPTGTDREYTVYDLSNIPEPLSVESGLLGRDGKTVLGVIPIENTTLNLILVSEYIKGKWRIELLFNPRAILQNEAQPRAQINPFESNVTMVAVPQPNQTDYFAEIFTGKNAVKYAVLSLVGGLSMGSATMGIPRIKKTLSMMVKLILPEWLKFKDL